ncbi:MAG TPA: apolipoprotein N-acyltransferase [Spirochaetota bacterium]|nr:apolipoprotein N-acyltransferase [Spirochaetota bacterium]HPI89262.1 apolipoprotein N-acyltransferase [Spirochaetota bacterium]HPR48578.1 apolipoprotein N-acyltransferase [Spirochaetota bacterium]
MKKNLSSWWDAMDNKVVSFCKKNYYLLTALLMFLAYPNYNLVLLKAGAAAAWIAFVPLFVFVKDKKPVDVYLYTFVAGLAGNYLCYYWIGQFGGHVSYGPAVILLFLIPYRSMFLGVKVLFAETLSRRYGKLGIVIYPSAWILVDWIESIGFLAFPWSYLGYSQYAFLPFIQVASLTGILGISFIIVLANRSLADLWVRRKSSPSLKHLLRTGEMKVVSVVAALVFACIVYGSIVLLAAKEPQKSDLRVSTIQSCISPWENWGSNRFRYLAELERITTESLADNPDLIVWSESATLEGISYDYDSGSLNDFEKELLGFVRTIDRPLVTGEIGYIDDLEGFIPQRYPLNSAVYINRFGEVIGNYAKIHLVPFGEWFPYGKWFPFVSEITHQFGGSDFIPGDRPLLFEEKGHPFGILICYEGIFYRLCREYKNLGARFFINITNDGWTDSYSGHMQHFSASIFRSIENGVWYVRAGNTGFSTIIDPYGRIRSSMPILLKGHVTGDMDFSLNRNTFYSRWGDLVLYAAQVMLAVLVLHYIYGMAKIWKSRRNEG